MKTAGPKDLSLLNTFQLPCLASHYLEFEQVADAIDYLSTLDRFDPDMDQDLLILGGGSNLVLPPKTDRLIIRLTNKTLDYQVEGEQARIDVGAGFEWDQLVAWSVAHGFAGIENLSLIPGSVGAAPVQNIGAYGVELKDVLEYVDVYDRAQQKRISLTNAECEFAYRDSVFKRNPGRFLIFQIGLVLSLKPEFKLEYGELKDLAGHQNLSLSQVRDKVIEVRQAKLPDPKDIPNAGSFFKNPIVDEATLTRLKNEFPNIIHYAAGGDRHKLAAGWMIDQSGWKGRSMGAAQVHDKQALVLTNQGAASQSEVLMLASSIQEDIYARYGVELEIEPIVV